MSKGISTTQSIITYSNRNPEYQGLENPYFRLRFTAVCYHAHPNLARRKDGDIE